MADYRKEGGGRGPDEGRGVATVKASGALRRPVRPCRAVDADARLCSTCPPCSVLVPSFALPSFGFACVPRFGFLVGAHTHTHTLTHALGPCSTGAIFLSTEFPIQRSTVFS